MIEEREKMTMYQILEYKEGNIEIYCETHNKEEVEIAFSEYTGDGEIYLVQVLKSNNTHGYYYKNNPDKTEPNNFP